MHQPFFREEVINAQKKQWLGNIVLSTPTSFVILSASSVATIGLIVLFLSFATYTRFTKASGVITPERGVLKVMAPLQGIVIERRAAEGQRVLRGEVLFILSSNKITQRNNNFLDANIVVKESIESRRKSLIDERERNKRLNAKQLVQLTNKLSSLRQEGAQLDIEISTITARVNSSRAQLSRYKDLVEKKFYSDSVLQQKNDEVLDQKARLDALVRSKIVLTREMISSGNEIDQFEERSKNEDSQLVRLLADVEQAGAMAEAQTKIVVVAPDNGTITGVMADVGGLTTNSPLLTLLPSDTLLEVHMYLPSINVGRIKKGQTVKLRYASFPHQEFGQFDGVIKDISLTPLTARELSDSVGNIGVKTKAEGSYRVSVSLASQYVSRAGEDRPLIIGSEVEVSVPQETRTLIKWLFGSVFKVPTSSLSSR